MPPCRALIVFFAALAFAGAAGAATSSGISSFNGKTVRYTFTGDEVSALSEASGGTCRVTVTVDGSTHRIVITEERLEWNRMRVPLEGYTRVEIEINSADARFTVDGKAVLVKPTGPSE